MMASLFMRDSVIRHLTGGESSLDWPKFVKPHGQKSSNISWFRRSVAAILVCELLESTKNQYESVIKP